MKLTPEMLFEIGFAEDANSEDFMAFVHKLIERDMAFGGPSGSGACEVSDTTQLSIVGPRRLVEKVYAAIEGGAPSLMGSATTLSSMMASKGPATSRPEDRHVSGEARITWNKEERLVEINTAGGDGEPILDVKVRMQRPPPPDEGFNIDADFPGEIPEA